MRKVGEDVAQCEARMALFDTVLRCELDAGHDQASEAAPQGSPHQSAEVPDPISGGPRRWWA